MKSMSSHYHPHPPKKKKIESKNKGVWREEDYKRGGRKEIHQNTHSKTFAHKWINNRIDKTIGHRHPMTEKKKRNHCIEFVLGTIRNETIVQKKLIEFDWHPTNSIQKNYSEHHFDCLPIPMPIPIPIRCCWNVYRIQCNQETVKEWEWKLE